MTNFDTKREASDFAESVASIKEPSMFDKVKMLLAADDEHEGIDAEVLKHRLAPVASTVKQTLRRLLSISADTEDYGTMPASSLRLRDDDPLFDMYMVITTGREGSFFIPGAAHVAALRTIDLQLKMKCSHVPGAELVGVYVKSVGSGKLELGVRIMRSSNDG